MLPVSLDCSCFIALSVFYNIYLSCVLSTLCSCFIAQFYLSGLVYSMLPVSLDCSCFITLSVVSNIYLSCVFMSFIAHVLLPFRFHVFVLCLVYSMLPVSLDCSCFIALSVVYNIYLSCVLSTLTCFICPVSCLLYVASFSGLFMFYYPFGIL